LQPLLSDLGGTITKNKISDFPSIPLTLSDLTETMLKNRTSDFPTIPAKYNTLYNTKAQINNVIAAYGNTLICTGSSF